MPRSIRFEMFSERRHALWRRLCRYAVDWLFASAAIVAALLLHRSQRHIYAYEDIGAAAVLGARRVLRRGCMPNPSKRRNFGRPP